MGFACDCVPSGQSQDRQFLRRKELLEARISNNFRLSCSRFLRPSWLHFLEADVWGVSEIFICPITDFWPGIVSGLPVTRTQAPELPSRRHFDNATLILRIRRPYVIRVQVHDMVLDCPAGVGLSFAATSGKDGFLPGYSAR
jgi:hypothetical protein